MRACYTNLPLGANRRPPLAKKRADALVLVFRRAVANDTLDVRVLPHEELHAQRATAVPLADAVVRNTDGDGAAARVPVAVLG
jgi:hypothetical protein